MNVPDEKEDGENYFTDCTFPKRNSSFNNQGKTIDGRYGKQWSKDKKC